MLAFDMKNIVDRMRLGHQIRVPTRRLRLVVYKVTAVKVKATPSFARAPSPALNGLLLLLIAYRDHRHDQAFHRVGSVIKLECVA